MKAVGANMEQDLYSKYPPSEPCSCSVCKNFCRRPGWWTVEQAEKVVASPYAGRLMLEIAPEGDFGVLSPAFRGCESYLAINEYSRQGCTFLKNGLCELHKSKFMPLECRFCHHDRIGVGKQCHDDLEKDWHTPKGQNLIQIWGKKVGLWQRLRSAIQ